MKRQAFIIPVMALLLVFAAPGCDQLDPACEGADYRFADLVLPGDDGLITDHLEYRRDGDACYFYSTVICDQACGSTSFNVTFAYRFITTLFRREFGNSFVHPFVIIGSSEEYYPSYKDATNPMTTGIFGQLFTLNEENKKTTPASFTVEVGFYLDAFSRTEQELRDLLKSMINFFHVNIEYLKLN